MLARSAPVRSDDGRPPKGSFRRIAENPTVTWLAVRGLGHRQALLESRAVQPADGLGVVVSHRLRGMRRVYLSPIAINCLLNAARGPLSGAGLRNALALSVERKALVETGMSGAARCIMGQGSGPHRAAVRALLADAGYADDLMLEVDCATRLADEPGRLSTAMGDHLLQVRTPLNGNIRPERKDDAHMPR